MTEPSQSNATNTPANDHTAAVEAGGNQRSGGPEQAPVADQSPAPEGAPHNIQSAQAAAGDTEADPFAVLDKLNEENAELKDKALRTLAELENMRRRSQKEVADAKAYGVTGFAREMLGFADNIRRAIENVPDELRADASPAKGFIEGIELTERDFLAKLKRHGVEKLEPQGQKFDPNMHEALFEVPDPSVPTGTIVQVVEDGYSIGERCLRPAKVGVARGGPKEAPATEQS